MIAKWKLKAIVQKTISFLPKPEKVNYLFQKYVTKGVYLNDEYFGFKIEHARDHIVYFKKYSTTSSDKRILELGTGWYPVVPIVMYLTNTGKLVSVDIQDWMTADSFRTTIEKFKAWHDEGKLSKYIEDIDSDKWNKLLSLLDGNLSLDELKEKIGLETYIEDARQTKFESDSFDFICSNNTFEHIYFDVLEGILKEFNRLIKPEGVMSHFIDMSDHFAHFDHSINIYNFLRYSESKWKSIDNSIQPQNRKRWRDYQELYDQLNIVRTEEEVRPGDVKALEQVPVHSSYENYSKEELAISHGYIVSKT